MIMICGTTWNSLPLPIACDLFGTHLPPYIYEIQTRCTSGVRPALVSLMNCRKTSPTQGYASRISRLLHKGALTISQIQEKVRLASGSMTAGALLVG